ncbi:MAG TPA: winged helix-turn-helix domain-containing protein, partial [Sphingomicrobium sp.]
GRHETLEPKVMQVLVALARHAGNVVSRDQLVDWCWEGRIVGDDALNRVIGRIRALASGLAEDSFRVETITKVGYRLSAGENQAATGGGERDLSSGKGSLLSRRTAALAVAATLVGLGAVAARQWPRNPAISAEAKALYDQAIALSFSTEPADDWQMVSYLREAVRIEPDYAQAWGKLALAYRGMLLDHPIESTAGFDVLMADAIRQAKRLDPDNSDALAAEIVSRNPYGDWARFDRTFSTFLRDNPGNPIVLRQQAMLFMNVGRWGDARKGFQALKPKRPLDPLLRYQLAVSTWAAGALSAAEVELDEALRRWPRNSAIWETKVKILALSGRPEAALAFAGNRDSRPLDSARGSNEQQMLWLKALASRSKEDIDKAINAHADSARRIAQQALPSALAIASLGRPDMALEVLKGYFLGVGPWAAVRPKPTRAGPQFTTHPLFQPHAKILWPLAGFTELLREIGLEDYWQLTKTLPDYRRA